MNGTSSAATLPVFPGANELSNADLWEHYVALGLPPDQATLHVQRRQRERQAIADNPLPTPQQTSPETAALLGAGRTATSGFQDELVGALHAMRGPPPQNLQQRLFGALGGRPLGPAFNTGVYQQSRDLVREAQAQALAEHPAVSLGAGFLGSQVNPLMRLLGPATQGMGAVKQGVTYGATLGGAQGIGEGTTAIDRAIQAVQGAVVGGAIGALGGIANKLWRAIFKSAPSPKIDEATVRARLAKMGYQPEQVEQAVGIWRGGKILPPPPPPPTVRPGETIAPMPGQPKGFEVTGTRATPALPTAPSILEIQQGRSLPDIGGGRTLPYYPRGGQVEQAFGSPGVTSPQVPAAPGMGNQASLLAEYLRGATPADLAQRISTLRALGVPLPPNAETAFQQLLFGPR